VTAEEVLCSKLNIRVSVRAGMLSDFITA
jgi:hypothetical protein